MHTKQILSLSDAKIIAAASVEEARRNNWNVVVAVVDDGGHLMYLERLDDTQKASSVIAVEKARTALMFRRPSLAFEDVVAKGRVAVMTLPGAVTVEGGLPIVVDGEYVGGVGVSGVHSNQDGQIAAAGVKAFMASLSRGPSAQ